MQDVVGLYVDPPEHALVLSVDEKSQIQALDRTQPGLPMKKGRCGTMTHDYKRHGTTTLFAALDVLEGRVIGQCMARHRHQEFIRFLNKINRETPAGRELHLIVDNYATHKHPKVRAWLERHPRFHFHFTPTSASWLNAVEGFFAKLTRQRLKRGVFKGIVDLQAAINRYLAETNRKPKALHLDRRSRRHHRKGPARETGVRVDPLVAQAFLEKAIAIEPEYCQALGLLGEQLHVHRPYGLDRSAVGNYGRGARRIGGHPPRRRGRLGACRARPRPSFCTPV